MQVLRNKQAYMAKEINQQEVSNIISTLREVSGVDFSNYAPSSLKRRFLRFMEIKKINESRELIQLTRSNSVFAKEFLNEVTVNVTEMFRDPSFWSRMKKDIIPLLAQRKSIKIWHAAGSTGEEVFSMAILLHRAGLLERSEILGSDINIQALEQARLGLIPKKKFDIALHNFKEVTNEFSLEDYFKHEENQYFLKPELLSRIKFKQQDLISSSAPGNFDMIICRNVFIYFNRHLQEKVLQAFSSSLEPGGILGIGAKESIEWCRSSRHFKSLNDSEKIYEKKNSAY